MSEEKISIILDEVKQHQLPYWKEFPDFDLYMDQLVSLGNRFVSPITSSKITPAMVNSYVKKKIMSKPTKKKYQAVHLAELIAVSLLKTVYSLDTVKTALHQAESSQSASEAYDEFAHHFNLLITSLEISNNNIKFSSEPTTVPLPEQFAIRAFIYKAIGVQLISKAK